MTAIQDLYPEDYAHCFGCGRDNPAGHRLKVTGKETTLSRTSHRLRITCPYRDLCMADYSHH